MSTNHCPFGTERRAEAVLNRGPSAYQPNALPLGQTGSPLVGRNNLSLCSSRLLSSKVVVCGHCLVTLSLTVNETLKWLSSLPILKQESFWW